MPHMELIVTVLALIGAYTIWKFFFKPNTFDKLSLLSLGVWRSQYDEAGLFTSTGMASSLLHQAALVAERLGSGITYRQFRKSFTSEKLEVNKVAQAYLAVIDTELSDYLRPGEPDQIPAAVALGILLLKSFNPSRYHQVMADPEQLKSVFTN